MQEENFNPSMIAGCEAALDAGVFYQDAFEDFVVKQMGGFNCEAHLAMNLLIDHRDISRTARQQSNLVMELEQRVAAMPRGHYAIIKTINPPDTVFFRFMVSDGSGKISTGGKFDSYDIEPGPEKVLRKMFGYEIYLCRKLVEQRRAKACDISAMISLNIHVGMKIKGYRASGEVKPFSSASVIEVHPETGMLKLLLIRRGTSKRWIETVGATRLKEYLTEVETPESSALF